MVEQYKKYTENEKMRDLGEAPDEEADFYNNPNDYRREGTSQRQNQSLTQNFQPKSSIGNLRNNRNYEHSTMIVLGNPRKLVKK